jgi:hypothetical protein
MWLKIKAGSVLARRASRSLTTISMKARALTPKVMFLNVSPVQVSTSLYVASSLAGRRDFAPGAKRVVDGRREKRTRIPG